MDLCREFVCRRQEGSTEWVVSKPSGIKGNCIVCSSGFSYLIFDCLFNGGKMLTLVLPFSPVQPVPSGKKYKFVATGHGQYKKVLIDDAAEQ